MDKKPLNWRISMFKDQKILQACIAHRHFPAEFWWAKPPETAVAHLQISEYHYAALIAKTTLARYSQRFTSIICEGRSGRLAFGAENNFR